MRYLDGLKSRDLQKALRCLQKYFDYTIKDNESSPIQYTALNMAALYTNLNYPIQALSSIQKGIMYARDQNDQDCLSLLLCWLHQIMYQLNDPLPNPTIQPSEMHVLNSLSSRTLAQKQYKLAALCELKKARCGIESGESSERVFEFIDGSQDLIVKHNLKRLDSSVLLTKAAACSYYGISTLKR